MLHVGPALLLLQPARLRHHVHVLHGLHHGHVHVPRAAGHDDLQATLLPSCHTAKNEPLPLYSSAGAQVAYQDIISGSSLIHVLPRQLVLLLSSIATTVSWFVFRKEDWSWILQVLRFLQFQLDTVELFLQDFLGIMFSINMLKVLRLPSLRICTILLSALFFYDIFFVFITPLFMSGKSVMVEVATGHSSDEQLPMVKQS